MAEDTVRACSPGCQIMYGSKLVPWVVVHVDKHPITNIEGVGLAVTVIATEDSLLGALVGVGDGLIILMEALDEIVGCFVDGITSGWWLGKVRQPSGVVAVGKEGRGELGIRNGGVVDGKLDMRNDVIPAFALCHCDTEELLGGLISPLSNVGLGMHRSSGAVLDVQVMVDRPHEVGDETGVAVRDNAAGDAVIGKDVPDVEFRKISSSKVDVTGDDLDHLCCTVNHDEGSIKPISVACDW